jgi:hypothetical protein
MAPTRMFSLALVASGVTLALIAVNASTRVPESPAATPIDGVKCDVSQYKASAGLAVTMEQDVLVVTWSGQHGDQLRSRFAIESGQPTIRDFAIRKAGSQWTTLGNNLTPEYRVVSGVRRLPNDQGNALRSLGVKITRDVIDQNRWQAFWDAPLRVPGVPDPPPAGRAGGAGRSAATGPPPPEEFPLNGGRVYELPRTPEEIRRATASFKATSCTVKSVGASVEVTYPGLSMGIFAGDLRFTIYRGVNLLQMDALASTQEQWVAYIYSGGLKGFSTSITPSVTWHDTGGHVQRYRFGGPVTSQNSALKASGRLVIAEGKGASLAVFTTPHSFYFSREKDTNLGYVYYRKDADTTYAVGIRMAEGEEPTLGPRLTDNPNQYADNFALYNAPPGTTQKMSVFFMAAAEGPEATRAMAMALTHDDTFKAVPGYKTFVNHFHLAFTDRTRGALDTPLQDLVAMKALGLNIIGLSDFHFELQDGASDVGPIRFREQKEYFEASRHASDADFLVTPWEEPSAFFGGHYNLMGPKPQYWAKVRRSRDGAELPFTETDPVYGKIYRAGSAEDVQQFLEDTNSYWYTAHPRTKNSNGFPDAYWSRVYGRSDRFLGIAFKPGMGQDQSEDTLCEWRCFDAIDTMNNLNAGSGVAPKYLIGDVDTYKKGPEDDLYAGFPVNYLKIDRTPAWTDDWTPILKAMRDGSFFVTTGEILIKNYAVIGTGDSRTLTADVEWTYPPAFMEIVMGDGKKVVKQRVSLRDQTAFGSKHIAQTVNVAGMAWVRLSIWDVATNGAFVQPVWLTRSTGGTR